MHSSLSAKADSKPPAGVTFGDRFGSSNLRSVFINPYRNETDCPSLVADLNEERYYFRQCLLSANGCEYGLSLALWVRFNAADYVKKEVLLSSSKSV